MADMASRPVQQKIVYAQTTQPTDERDGVMWIDTSVETRPLHVYSETSSQWEKVSAEVPILVTQEAVSFGESGTVLNQDGTHLTNGALEIPDTAPRSEGSLGDINNDSAETGLIVTPKASVDSLTATPSSNNAGITRHRLIRDSDGTVLETINAGVESVTFSTSLSAGATYRVIADAEGATYDHARQQVDNAPFSYPAITVEEGYYNNGGASLYWYTYESVEMPDILSGTATVGFGSIPTDLSAWDIQTWQQYENQGSVTADVEVDDGSGWSTHATDVLPPVDISGVDSSHDVRASLTLSRSAESDTSPQIPYVARRGER